MRRGHFLRQLRILIWKDLLVEARGRETVLAGAVFALLVLVIFNFAFDLRVENVAAVAPGCAPIPAPPPAGEVMLPLLLFPIQVPVILATVKSTGAAIRVPGLDPPDIGQWLGLLIAFDALFLGLSVLLFDYAIEED